MSNVLNKFTKQYLRSVNTPDYPTSEWFINPILPPCDQKFWLIVGDTIREMTQSEKNTYLYTHESTVYLIVEKQLLAKVDGADYETDANTIINPIIPNCDMKYTKAVSGEVVEMSEAEKDAVDLVEAIPARQTQIKQECTAHILAAYPEPIQRSVAMGIYANDVIDNIKAFIASCVEEENRCYDLLEAATIIEEVDTIIPTFPEA